MKNQTSVSRRIHPAEIAILLVATIVGCAIIAVCVLGRPDPVYPVISMNYNAIFIYVVRITIALVPLMATWAAALAVIALWRAGGRISLLAERRGFLACLSIVIGSAYGMGLILMVWLFTFFIFAPGNERVWVFFVSDGIYKVMSFISAFAGSAILMSWVCVSIRKSSCPEGGTSTFEWVESTSIALGVVWVATSIFVGWLHLFIGDLWLL